MALIDGLLVSGGNDVDPLEYGETDAGRCGRIIPQRDKQEKAAIQWAMQRHMPLLCICRGMQILNVALGGSLYQEWSETPGRIPHMKSNYPMNGVAHFIQIDVGSALSRIVGTGTLGVNSFHHQAVKQVGEQLKAVATAEDGAIEAVEGQGPSFLLGLQWHPEKMYDGPVQQQIFQAFIRACGQA